MWSINNFLSFFSSSIFKIVAAVTVLILTTVIMIVIVVLSEFSQVHPWPVLIQFNREQPCSGSLIHRKHVLTSASCVEHVNYTVKSELKVIVGMHSNIYEVADIFAHPNYDYSTLEHNIAVIILKQEVALTKYVRSLLPEPELELDEGKKVFVVETRSTMITSYVTDNKTCQKHFADTHFSGTFCAVLPSQYSNCLIDLKGAPVTLNKKYSFWFFSVTSNKNYVVGIFSKSSSSCGTKKPNLYTHVASYLDFIEKQITSTD